MSDSGLTGYALLKKQRETKLKRLSSLSMKDYFQSMEEVRQGKPLNPQIKRYLFLRP